MAFRTGSNVGKEGDFQYAPLEEIVTFGVSVAFAVLAAWSING